MDSGSFVGGPNHLGNQRRFVQQVFLAGRARSILKRGACAIAATLSCAALIHSQATVPPPAAAPSTTVADALALREVTDETGRAIRVPQSIHRIVSLAPSLTETLYALGLQERLVGDTDFCDFPPEAQKKAKVGGAINPSIETIASLHPDLVLVTKSLNRLDAVRALADLGIPSYATDPHTVDDIVSSTQHLAELLGAHEAGSAIATDLKRRLADMHERIASSPQRRVLFVVWPDPLISVGKGTFIADTLVHAGAASIVESSQNWPQISLEEVVHQQPEFLIFAESHSGTAPPTLEALANLPGWRILDAVRNHHIALVSDAVNRPAPRIVDVIEDLARELHPEAFADKPENGKDKAIPPAGVPPPPDMSWLSSSSLLTALESSRSSAPEDLSCAL
jgi:iron complex transport system substrate-binding protein